MPSIAFVLKSFYQDHIGGAERQVQMLAQALREQGWNTAYICERAPNKPRREVVDGMTVLALPVRKKRITWMNYRVLRGAMKESQADIFYQRTRHPYTGLTAFCARRLKRPFIFAAASIADVNQHEDLFKRAQADSPKDSFFYPLNRGLEDWGIKRASAIILQTAEQLHLLESHYDRPGVVIPNHIVVDSALQPLLKRPPPEILWVSNVKPMKRPELFVALAQRFQNIEARFVMAGSCVSATMMQMIRDAEETLSNFVYIGPLPPPDCEKRIAEATLVINTSEFEGFPNVLQQAWANGVPTLTLGVDPDGVIVREGLGGNAKSLDELESLVRRFLSDEQFRLRIGRQARDFARRTYDLKLLLPHYLSLFEKLIRS